MKDNFIYQAATYIKSHSHKGIKQVIVPSKRAELYMARALYQSEIEVLCFDDWVKKFIPSTTKMADKSELILAFFETYASEHPEDAELEDFIKWASTAIDDFIAIDQARVDAKQLYNYLTDTKAIDLWNPEQTSLTDNQQRYLQFFKSQHHLYMLFQRTLSHKSWVTKATAVNSLLENLLSQVTDQYFYWVGFNALTNGQKQLFEQLNKAGKAQFIWDTDSYYLNVFSNEAGNHIRENLANFGRANSVIFSEGVSKIDRPTKSYSLIASSRQLPQAKYLYDLLNSFTEDEINQTAIIAANENLLPAILSSLPEKVKHINVSLSYPIKNLSVFQWAISYLNFLSSVKNPEEEKPRYYIRSLIDWMNSPMSRRVFERVDALIQTVLRYNVPYLTTEKILELGKVEHSFLTQLLKGDNQPNNIIKLIREFYDVLKKNVPTEEALLCEEIEAVDEFFKKLDEQFEHDFFRLHINSKGLRKIIEQGASSLSLSYKGQPLKGLQILSLLETNCLSFDRVIILGCNEGFLPRTISHHSFIPYDVRRVFDLPLPAYHDAIYAYSFYRLLQHPDKVYLMYDTDADSFGSGEMSRYLLQLKNELCHAKIEERIAIFETSNAGVSPQKSYSNNQLLHPEVEKFLCERGVTPTALSTYISCSLKFFYRFVIRLEEKVEVEEFLGADMLGKLVHRTLELLYQPYIKQVIQKSTIDSIRLRFEECFELACQENDVVKLSEDGKNLLLLNIAKQYINMYLTYEYDYLSELETKNQVLTLSSLEEKLIVYISVPRAEGSLNVLLKGVADRIDRIGEVHRILDYKTGKVEAKMLTVSELEDLFESHQYSKALQLLHYSYIMNRKDPNAKIHSGIISFRSLSKGLQMANFSKLGISDEELFNHYEKRIVQFVHELLNPETKYEMTKDTTQCDYCSFNALCMRN